MFEYLMPSICFPDYKNSLINKSNKLIIYLNEGYSSPWGISESAFNVKDLHSNYQYKAFGIPWLGLKRGLKDEIVVSPYASVLALSMTPKDVLKNIEVLKKIGAYNKFGLYESIDYTPSRVKEKYEIVKPK